METLKEIIQHEGREYVLANSSVADDRVQILKHGDQFGVFDRHGDILRLQQSAQGLYCNDTRFMSEFVLRLGGERPLLLSSRITRDNTALIIDLTNPPIVGRDELPLRQDTLHLERTRVLWKDCSYESIVATNFGNEYASVDIRLEFAADFADIFEVRGQTRPARGRILDPLLTPDAVVLGYQGLDGVLRQTTVHFHPMPAQLLERNAVFSLELPSKESVAIEIVVEFSSAPSDCELVPFSVALQNATKQREASHVDECQIETSNERFDTWLERSRADLAMLCTESEQGLFPHAGTPWFSTPFGRDSLITALQTITFHPRLARGVLAYLANYQAEEVDPEREAEPGKILHEARYGEMAALEEVPFRQYFGSVDATPLFVMLAGVYLRSTGDVEFLEEIWPNVQLALKWMEDFGDKDGDGFIEYARTNHKGIQNQAWKDSDDSVFHADGRLATGAVAAVEVQGYAYSAWLNGAWLARQFEAEDLADRYERRAAGLRDLFNKSFWCDAIGTYGIALDGEKQLCCVRSSNPGHCLYAGIVRDSKAARVGRALLQPDMFSGWGVRTIGEREKRYNPMSYHNGSVWPHDNSLIAAGLARYGLKREAGQIMTSMFRASEFFDLHRLPELFCGFPRTSGDGPTMYPVACTPQAWAAGSPYLLLQSCLGMEIDATQNRVHFNRPMLPAYVDEVVMKRLRVGRRQLDIRLQRYAETVGVDVLRRDGPVMVHVTT
jgi:glycogen debranching enzyme